MLNKGVVTRVWLPTSKMTTHAQLMREAFGMAEHALAQREVPVGCVVVDEDGSTIVARGCNEVNATMNATRHAEMIVIDRLVELSKEKRVDLRDMCAKYTLYVTVEPCVMCTYALRTVGLTNIVFGCSNSRFGGCGSVIQAATMELYPPEADSKAERLPLPPLRITSGVMEDKAIALLQQFYKGENPLAPEDKVKHKQQTK